LTALVPHKPSLAITLLRLGRVSNLATVWTNVLAATVIAGASWKNPKIAIIAVAMSCFYVSGMYLNDYYDRFIDARERPERAIPAGHILAPTVASIAFGMLIVAIVMMASFGLLPSALSLVLAAVIVWYDIIHKRNSFGPVVMGLCRGLIYIAAAAAIAGTVSATIVIMALSLGAYIAGITYAARQESFDKVGSPWPLLLLATPMVAALPAFKHGLLAVTAYLVLAAVIARAIHLLAKRPMAGAVSRAVGLLIAAISLVDAALLASVGAIEPALLAIVGFIGTLQLQKYVAGT
jgi:4-hydroxybenzoate polyprenyltransferase